MGAATGPIPHHRRPSRPPADPEPTQPTDVLPRNRVPLGEQPTTALPRRPVPPPTGPGPPWSPRTRPPIAPRPRRRRVPLSTAAAATPPTPATRVSSRAAPAAIDVRPSRRRPRGHASAAVPRAAAGVGGPDRSDGRPSPLAARRPTAAQDHRHPGRGARSRELTLRGVDLFHRATTADGADRSGLAHLTYAQMANYACDAALAVALANTLFLVKPEEGPGRVLLYLLITVAPFALVAPLIGPFLDRLQTGPAAGAGAVDGRPRPAGHPDDLHLLRRRRQLGALSVRARVAGAEQVLRRAEGVADPAGAAGRDHPGRHQLPADRLRVDRRRCGRRRWRPV